MKELLNSQIAQGVLVTLICAVLFWIVSLFRYKIDENKIITFLRKSKNETDYTFRGEPAISSETNLSEDRVNKVCSKSNQIKRNKNDKKSWCLSC